MTAITFRVHFNVPTGLSCGSTFAVLISVDGYEERQATEAHTSLAIGSRASDLSPVNPEPHPAGASDLTTPSPTDREP